MEGYAGPVLIAITVFVIIYFRQGQKDAEHRLSKIDEQLHVMSDSLHSAEVNIRDLEKRLDDAGDEIRNLNANVSDLRLQCGQ